MNINGFWPIRSFRSLGRDRSGAAALEYALLLAMIAVATVGAMDLLGLSISESYNATTEELADAGGGSSSGGSDAGEPQGAAQGNNAQNNGNNGKGNNGGPQASEQGRENANPNSGLN